MLKALKSPVLKKLTWFHLIQTFHTFWISTNWTDIVFKENFISWDWFIFCQMTHVPPHFLSVCGHVYVSVCACTCSCFLKLTTSIATRNAHLQQQKMCFTISLWRSLSCLSWQWLLPRGIYLWPLPIYVTCQLYLVSHCLPSFINPSWDYKFLEIISYCLVKKKKKSNTLQYSCLENPMNRGACWGCKELDMTKATSHTHTHTHTLTLQSGRWMQCHSPSLFLVVELQTSLSSQSPTVVLGIASVDSPAGQSKTLCEYPEDTPQISSLWGLSPSHDAQPLGLYSHSHRTILVIGLINIMILLALWKVLQLLSSHL